MAELDNFIDSDIEDAWIVEAEKRWQEIELVKVDISDKVDFFGGRKWNTKPKSWS